MSTTLRQQLVLAREQLKLAWDALDYTEKHPYTSAPWSDDEIQEFDLRAWDATRALDDLIRQAGRKQHDPQV